MKKSTFEFKDVGCCEIHKQALIPVGEYEVFVNDLDNNLYTVTIFKNGILSERKKMISGNEVEAFISSLK